MVRPWEQWLKMDRHVVNQAMAAIRPYRESFATVRSKDLRVETSG
jgi:hypothetical protein